MANRRMKDIDWRLSEDSNGNVSLDTAQLAVLMDIRDELKRLNSLLHCANFQDIPRKMERTARNTAGIKRFLSEKKENR